MYNVYYNSFEILMTVCQFMKILRFAQPFLIPNYIKVKRRDLATLYFPGKEPREAVRSLLGWIKNCPDLVAALNDLHIPYLYKKEFTVRQVRLIMEYLGDP